MSLTTENNPQAPSPTNIFTDPHLNAGAKVLFAIIAGFDRGRGCWAARQTLARLSGASLSSVNHWIAALSGRGYLSVERQERRPAILRAHPDARRLSGLLQSPARADLQQAANINSSCTAFKKQEETTNSYQEGTYPVAPETDGGPVVVSEKPKNIFSKPESVRSEATRNQEETRMGVRAVVETEMGVTVVEKAGKPSHAVAELVEAGVHVRAAKALARTYPARKVSAAIRYVHGSRSAVLNPPGYIRFILEAGMRIPRWCFQDTPPASRAQEMPAAPRSVPHPAPDPVPASDRKAHRKASRYAPVWDAAQETIRQQIMPESFDRWIAPLSIADASEEQVILSAPDPDTAEWVAEHYLWALLPALVAAGMPCKSIVVKAHTPGSASDV